MRLSDAKRLGPLASVLVAALLLTAGCASPAARASSAAPVRTHEVTMPPSYRFEPSTIEVPAGTVVTFHNTDNFTHSVQVQGQADHQVKPGESVDIAFATPGTFPYICTLHTQNMHGTVIVTPS